MDNKKRHLSQRVKGVESPNTAKTKKPEAPEPKNVTEPKDSRTMPEPKKSPLTDLKEKKTMSLITDQKDKRHMIEPKDKKTVTVSEPKIKKPGVDTKKRMVTFLTEIKDKMIVVDTRENKIAFLDTKQKVIVPFVPEAKEKKPVQLIKSKEKMPEPFLSVLPVEPIVPVGALGPVGPIVPIAAVGPIVPIAPVVPIVPVAPTAPVASVAQVVPEIEEKISVPGVKDKKELPTMPQIKDTKALPAEPKIKEKVVTKTKEKAAMTETKEKKTVSRIKKKKSLVGGKKADRINEIARSVVQGVLAAAVELVEGSRDPIKNIDWLTHGEFTVEKGRQQIEMFVSSWDFQNRWVFHADFVEKKDFTHSFHYIYRVCWSAPTAVKPMAQFSANAYFTIKFNKSKSPDMPVDVSYVFENSELLQRPGNIRFREQWLRDITETKHILLESIPFKFA
nr:A-kinase anchor protein 14 [Meriones unguiculatus]